ncbi:Inositol 1,4,5-trisphosphate receptor type 2, partial [Clarias magur]
CEIADTSLCTQQRAARALLRGWPFAHNLVCHPQKYTSPAWRAHGGEKARVSISTISVTAWFIAWIDQGLTSR